MARPNPWPSQWTASLHASAKCLRLGALNRRLRTLDRCQAAECLGTCQQTPWRSHAFYAEAVEGPSSVDAKNSTTWRIATAAASIAWPCATPGTSMKVPRGIAAAAAVPAAGG